MFPVRASSGDVVGFTARDVADAGSASPKWLNTRGTELYDKSKLLVGLSEQTHSADPPDAVLLVEGAADVLAPGRRGRHPLRNRTDRGHFSRGGHADRSIYT